MGGNPQSGAGRLLDAPRSLEPIGAQVGTGPRTTSLHPTPQGAGKTSRAVAPSSHPFAFLPCSFLLPLAAPPRLLHPLSRRPGGDKDPTRCTAGSS